MTNKSIQKFTELLINGRFLMHSEREEKFNALEIANKKPNRK